MKAHNFHSQLTRKKVYDELTRNFEIEDSKKKSQLKCNFFRRQ